MARRAGIASGPFRRGFPALAGSSGARRYTPAVVADRTREQLEFFRDLGVSDVFLDRKAARAEGSVSPGSMPDLPSLQAFLEGCPRCKLSKSRTNIVFGQGNPRAELMFVGEAPGRDEDEQGLAFVGRAGQLLTKIIEAIGSKREDVFIANVLKCLRYNAAVQLGDGSWERIGRLVRSRYAGTVMSVDRGCLVARRVIGWHATALGDRRVYRLSYASANRVGAARASIELTGDHPVLTDRGYVPAGDIAPGTRIATGQGLSSVARDVVWGTLLGDGHLRAGNGFLSFSHPSRQAEYALFKSALLEELSPVGRGFRVAAVAGGPARCGVVEVRTRAHRALGFLRSEFYRPRKRVPPSLDGCLNDRMLAIWFMDDGDTRIRPPRRPLSEIATCGFDDDDRSLLLRELDRVGLPARALDGRLFFDATTSGRLSERLSPYVPPAMRYKLDPAVSSSRPYDPSRWAPGEAEVLFDEAEIEDVTSDARSDKTFFLYRRRRHAQLRHGGRRRP